MYLQLCPSAFYNSNLLNRRDGRLRPFLTDLLILIFKEVLNPRSFHKNCRRNTNNTCDWALSQQRYTDRIWNVVCEVRWRQNSSEPCFTPNKQKLFYDIFEISNMNEINCITSVRSDFAFFWSSTHFAWNSLNFKLDSFNFVPFTFYSVIHFCKKLGSFYYFSNQCLDDPVVISHSTRSIVSVEYSTLYFLNQSRRY